MLIESSDQEAAGTLDELVWGFSKYGPWPAAAAGNLSEMQIIRLPLGTIQSKTLGVNVVIWVLTSTCGDFSTTCVLRFDTHYLSKTHIC